MPISLYKPVSLAAVVSVLSQTGFAAPVVVPKPFAPTNAAEFGVAVARAGDYAIASSTQATAMQDAMACLNVPTQSCFQGLVAVYKGASATPEAVYQFPGQYSFTLPSTPEGWSNYPIAVDPTAHFFLQAGKKVAIANKWLAFSTGSTMNWAKSNKIFIAAKNSNGWDTCPTTHGVVDCNNASEPLALNTPAWHSKPLQEVPAGDDFALSDEHLAVLHGNTLTIYSHSPLSNFWHISAVLNPLEGAASTALNAVRGNIALDGPNLAVALTNHEGTQNELQIYNFNTRTRNWAKTDSASTTLPNFGHQLAMKEGTLAVASNADRFSSDANSGYVAIYRIDANGKRVEQSLQTTSHLTTGLAVSSGHVLRYHYPLGEELATTYAYNASQKNWAAFGRVYSYDFPRQDDDLGGVAAGPSGLYRADISNGLLTVGYKGQSLAGVPLVGTLFVQPITDTALNRSCLAAANNTVANCEFNTPYQNWTILNHNGAYATSDFNQNSLNIQVHQSGSQPWHVQARTWVNLAAAGNYTLRFRAKKSIIGADSRQLQFSVGHNGAGDNNWASYASRPVQVTGQWQTFTYRLKNIPADGNAVLDFNLGKSDIAAGNPSVDAISLDSVVLSKD